MTGAIRCARARTPKTKKYPVSKRLMYSFEKSLKKM